MGIQLLQAFFLLELLMILSYVVWNLLCLNGFFKCFRGEHSMNINDMGKRDETGWLNWKCQRCGKNQRVECGLDVEGKITGARLK